MYLRHLERYPLGTKYGEIVACVKGFSPGALPRRMRYTRLLADKTGVGAAVIDGFYEKGVYPIGVTIHGGSAVTRGGRCAASGCRSGISSPASRPSCRTDGSR